MAKWQVGVSIRLTRNIPVVISVLIVTSFLTVVDIVVLSRNGTWTTKPSVFISCTTLILCCWERVVIWTAPTISRVAMISTVMVIDNVTIRSLPSNWKNWLRSRCRLRIRLMFGSFVKVVVTILHPAGLDSPM